MELVMDNLPCQAVHFSFLGFSFAIMTVAVNQTWLIRDLPRRTLKVTNIYVSKGLVIVNCQTSPSFFSLFLRLRDLTWRRELSEIWFLERIFKVIIIGTVAVVVIFSTGSGSTIFFIISNGSSSFFIIFIIITTLPPANDIFLGQPQNTSIFLHISNSKDSVRVSQALVQFIKKKRCTLCILHGESTRTFSLTMRGQPDGICKEA